jgi:hypothetical protein
MSPRYLTESVKLPREATGDVGVIEMDSSSSSVQLAGYAIDMGCGSMQYDPIIIKEIKSMHLNV